MTATQLALAATILLLFPMLYFLIASLTFFLAKLRDPVVTRMLRGLFATCFAAFALLGGLAALAFLASGALPAALTLGLAAALAAQARSWFLRRIDQAVRARDSGEPDAVGRLRRLHLAGMGYNAAQLALFVASIPRMLG